MSAALPSLAPGAPLVSAPTTSSTSFSGAGPSEPSRLVRRATTSTPSRSRRGDLSAGTVRSTRRLTHFGLGTLHAPLTASPSADEAGLRTPSSATSSLRITNSNSGASSRGASPSAPPPTTPEASSASHSRGETSLSDSISSSAGLHVQLSKEEMALWTDAQAMLEDDVLRGSNRLQRHLAAEPKACPYWRSFSHESLDHDAVVLATSALLTATPAPALMARPTPTRTRTLSSGNVLDNVSRQTAAPTPPPRRVLDIGCGVSAEWILAAAKLPGWESTQFTGVDVASAWLQPAMLPYDLATRLGLLTHNVLERRLPFGDAKFDYVRVGHLGAGVPEPKWTHVLDEAGRVLAPHGVLEIADADIVVDLRRVTASSKALSAASTVAQELDEILADRWINKHTLAVLPSAIAMSLCSHITTIATRRLSLPGHASLEPGPATDLTLGSAMRVGAAPLIKDNLELPPDTARVLLHSHANMMASGSKMLARHAGQREHGPSERDVEHAVQVYTDDLRHRSGLPGALERAFDWRCSYDDQLAGNLATLLPACEQEVHELELERAELDWDSDASDSDLDEADEGAHARQLSLRIAQLRVAAREAHVDLAAVKHRLHLDDDDSDADAAHVTLGVFEFGCFAAHK